MRDDRLVLGHLAQSRGAAQQLDVAGVLLQLLLELLQLVLDLVADALDDATGTIRSAFDPPTTWLRLLHYLAATPGGTACACTLPDALGISQPTMSHHLAKLVDAGLLTRERRGRWAHYSVATDGVRRQIDALAALLDHP